MESALHKHLKHQGLLWLRQKTKDLCATEVKLVYRRKKLKADVMGIDVKQKQSRIIEVKASRSDFLRDEVLTADYGYHHLSTYSYLLTPVGLLKKEEIPTGYGLLEIDDYDRISVVKKPIKNVAPKLRLETLIKRAGRAATNAFVFQQESLQIKDPTEDYFAKDPVAHLVRATCPSCKQRHNYFIYHNQESVPCQKKSCSNPIDLTKARTHRVTSYNKHFYDQLTDALRKQD
ncbi:hypothetical protein FLK61_33530 [Paenalkalicoccus suaedae]|uniref:Uncharacterized protein n=1 Tax=Paenalkalicoccus suaedae TaxID=2592382 RepID=A0A859FEK7_9BACI|nr:hypothetical protein [Paenalkalicoccus suaedae]QKS71609.1 hypothetical protein FLK61_33530 [Paenalkalicoccus suaedae]